MCDIIYGILISSAQARPVHCKERSLVFAGQIGDQGPSHEVFMMNQL